MKKNFPKILIVCLSIVVLILYLNSKSSPPENHSVGVPPYKVTMISMVRVLEQYKSDYGEYPTSSDGLDILLLPSDVSDEGYIKRSKIPLDPWGQDYDYTSDGINYQIRSAGPDLMYETDDDIVFDRNTGFNE